MVYTDFSGLTNSSNHCASSFIPVEETEHQTETGIPALVGQEIWMRLDSWILWRKDILLACRFGEVTGKATEGFCGKQADFYGV